MPKILEYGRWGNFANVVNKTKEASRNSRNDVNGHIADVNNMIKIGKGAKRRVDDYELSRYACYLIVQNSDLRKELVGQTYFAIQTRRQESSSESVTNGHQLKLEAADAKFARSY